MKLYTLHGNNDIVTVDVIKETPKGYKVDQETTTAPWYVPKFIKKFAHWTGWQPASIMAIKDMREILKRLVAGEIRRKAMAKSPSSLTLDNHVEPIRENKVLIDKEK